MAGPFYFAWVDPTETTFEPEHIRYDEEVLSIDLDHEEGNFANLTLVIRNPRIGLLAPTRKQWAWLSWKDSEGSAHALFFGHLVGLPSDLFAETLTIELIAKPSDYATQQATIAASMQSLPSFDPVWLQDNLTDPDTVLEAVPSLWHIDRTTLEVTASDIIEGEDGTLTFGENNHFYADMQATFTQTPLNQVTVQATVTWTQIASGTVDITNNLALAFNGEGSPFSKLYVSSLTGDGLLSSWPAPLTSIGGGWSVSADSFAIPATWIAQHAVNLSFTFGINPPGVQSGLLGPDAFFADEELAMLNPVTTYNVTYDITVLNIGFKVDYAASRDRSEIVNFTLFADVQTVFTDPGDSAVASVTLSSNFVDKQIDAGGAIPIGNVARPSYFKTDRGQQSFQYLLLLARTQLLSRARCCNITIKTKFETIATSGISCRMSATVTDGRLPGGTATGKIIAYTMHTDGQGGKFGTITIGCTVGSGGSVAASPGSAVYVDDDYFADGDVQIWAAADVDPDPTTPGTLTYESWEDFELDDDGVDFFNMTPDRVVDSITVTGGLSDQIAAVQSAARHSVVIKGLIVGSHPTPPTSPDPSGALQNLPTVVTLNMVPVTGGAFQTTFAPTVSHLKVPQTIDLSATS